MLREKMIAVENQVNKMMAENGLHFGGAYKDAELPIIKIELSGDWKHGHLFLKNLMSEQGFIYMGENVTNCDGSDWYEAIHTFIVPDRLLK